MHKKVNFSKFDFLIFWRFYVLLSQYIVQKGLCIDTYDWPRVRSHLPFKMTDLFWHLVRFYCFFMCKTYFFRKKAYFWAFLAYFFAANRSIRITGTSCTTPLLIQPKNAPSYPYQVPQKFFCQKWVILAVFKHFQCPPQALILPWTAYMGPDDWPQVRSWELARKLT